MAQLDFGPKNAIFEKPKEPVTHLKPLYLRGHINGSPLTRMLVDGGAVVNLMPYSVFRKLGLPDDELIKTNMVLNGFEGKERTEAKGVIYVEFIVGSKTLATAFFVSEVQGNYNVILGRDWVLELCPIGNNKYSYYYNSCIKIIVYCPCYNCIE